MPLPNLLAAEEELVAGRRPVEEAFVARRPARRLLVVPQRRQALERLVLHATSLRIPVVEVEGGTLTAIAGFDGHQGVALVVEPRTWASPDEILARAVDRGEPPFILVLDSLEDPQNVGTLLRSAEAAGVHGVLFPTRHQAPLTPAAVKASAGAVEHLLLAPVDDLPGAMSDLRVRGLRIAAAEAEAPLAASDADLRGPLAIVVGSEGSGLSSAVRRRADLAVRIPMRGAIGSLNAAVAGSILLFAAVAQRTDDGDAARPPVAPPVAGAPGDDVGATAASATDPDAGEAAPPIGEETSSSADAGTAIPAAAGAATDESKTRRTPAKTKRATATGKATQSAARTRKATPSAPETEAGTRSSAGTRKPRSATKARRNAPDQTPGAPADQAGGRSAGTPEPSADDADDLLPGGPPGS